MGGVGVESYGDDKPDGTPKDDEFEREQLYYANPHSELRGRDRDPVYGEEEDAEFSEDDNDTNPATFLDRAVDGSDDLDVRRKVR